MYDRQEQEPTSVIFASTHVPSSYIDSVIDSVMSGSRPIYLVAGVAAAGIAIGAAISYLFSLHVTSAAVKELEKKVESTISERIKTSVEKPQSATKEYPPTGQLPPKLVVSDY